MREISMSAYSSLSYLPKDKREGFVYMILKDTSQPIKGYKGTIVSQSFLLHSREVLISKHSFSCRLRLKKWKEVADIFNKPEKVSFT